MPFCVCEIELAAAAFLRLFALDHEMRHDVDGQGENDGGVLLGGNASQGLEVTELRGNAHFISGFFSKSSRKFVKV